MAWIACIETSRPHGSVPPGVLDESRGTPVRAKVAGVRRIRGIGCGLNPWYIGLLKPRALSNAGISYFSVDIVEIKKYCAVRCWRVTADGQRHVGWLVGERATRGQPEERKYYWSNLPALVPLEELAGYAHRRYAVEQFHEEAEGEPGWDHYQGRSWPGFHRHAVTVMLAYSFLAWLELCQRRSQPRRGRPRAPFSPSARSAEALAASSPSRDRPVAAPPSRPMVDHN
jgi:hypothetical protein